MGTSLGMEVRRAGSYHAHLTDRNLTYRLTDNALKPRALWQNWGLETSILATNYGIPSRFESQMGPKLSLR